MPDPSLTPDKRSLDPDQVFTRNPRAPFVELGVTTCFSFLHGASDPVDLVLAAWKMGYHALGVADRNSMAGVVRLHSEARVAKVAPLIGTRLILADGAQFLAYPTDRAAYGRLCALISKGRMRDLSGGWQEKGRCDLSLDDLAARQDGTVLIAVPGDDLDAFEARLPALARALPSLTHIAAAHAYRGDDHARIERLDRMARARGLRIVATNDVHYHTPERRPLQDVMTCIRAGCRIDEAGHRLHANAERYLKSPQEIVRLFARWPEAVSESLAIARRLDFTLDDLRYEYPRDDVPEGRTPDAHLRHLTEAGARRRWPGGVPDRLRETIETELAFIARKELARYFVTIQEIVAFARSRGILCQGRGSAANSVVCFCLGITSVDPAHHEVLFERFLSEERDEPPDIDVDFEHERREEVIQHIYDRYGRAHAGLCATVIHYRPRMAVREVGKVMGLSEDVTNAMARTVWGSHGASIDDGHLAESGLNLRDPHLRRVIRLTDQLIGMPRHLSQHVGGFILTDAPLTETVPIGNGAMPDRTFIEWDKDDIDALGIFKMDVLALGMLTCIAKAFGLMRDAKGIAMDLAGVPAEDAATYRMLQRGDSLGVFQVESRAQMAMLPKLKPDKFYDLVIQVAIVRPGPIQGDMVHPYLKRRRSGEVIEYPKPSPDHGPADELEKILKRTLGVPIFQEQAMKIALSAARFTGAEANSLRRAMATFRAKGQVSEHKARMVGRMIERGYDPDFAARCFSQIEGFGEYGFPESHAASFAHLVYVSAWLKRHHPDVFACALLNSQPMGFYAPAQIVDMARRSGVTVLPVDVNFSDWDCTLEPAGAGLALRLGMRQVSGLAREEAERLVTARGAPYAGVADLHRRTRASRRAIGLLAAADAFRSAGQDRRAALWDARAIRTAPALPLFAHADAPETGQEAAHTLPPMPLREEVVADYQTARLSLKAHPMAFLRTSMAGQGFVPAAGLRRLRFNQTCRVAGLVLIRQRPGSAKGVCFVTLEDETGVVNVVIWPDTFARFRPAIMGARLMEVRGYVQFDDAVIHVVAREIVNRDDALMRLSEDELRPDLARADHVRAPLPSPERTHPRDARVIPKSRDFH